MITPQLLEYIKISISTGLSREEITAALMQNGWKTEDIQAGFESLASVASPTSVTPMGVSAHSKLPMTLVVTILVVVLLGAGFWVWTVEQKTNDEAPVIEKSFSSIATTSPVSTPTAIENAVVEDKVSAITAVSTTTAVRTPTIVSTTTVNQLTLHGKAFKGQILNAKIRAFEIRNGKKSGLTKEVEIDSSGNFSVTMPEGIVLLQVITRKGSVTKDEKLAVDVPLPLDFSFRAAIDLTDETRKSVGVSITAFSEAAVVLAEKNGGLLPKNVNQANSGIADILGVDFLSTQMIQSNDEVRLASATPAEKKMAILNAALSEMASTDKMGCGVQPTYGDTINCTIAKFAEGFSAENW